MCRLNYYLENKKETKFFQKLGKVSCMLSSQNKLTMSQDQSDQITEKNIFQRYLKTYI